MAALNALILRLGADADELATSLQPHCDSDITKREALDATTIIQRCITVLEDAQPPQQHAAVDIMLQLVQALVTDSPADSDENQGASSYDHERILQELSTIKVIDTLVAQVTTVNCVVLLNELVNLNTDAKTLVSRHATTLITALCESDTSDASSALLRLLVNVADSSIESIAQVTDHTIQILSAQPVNEPACSAIVELLASLHVTGSAASSELVLNVLSQVIAGATAPLTPEGKPFGDALVRLAAKASLVEPLVEARVISACVKPLKRLLEGRPSTACVSGHDALAILSSISQSWDFGGLLLDEGAVSVLVSLVLTTSVPQVQAQCAEILSNISWTDEPTRQVVAVTGCLDVFIEMLRSNDTTVRNVGVGAIAAVCKENEENIARVPVENAIINCVEMLQIDNDDRAKTLALRLITCLVDDDVIGEDVACHSQLIDLVVAQLASSTKENQIQAVLAIGGLVGHRAGREHLSLMGIEATLETLERESSELAEYASMALAALREPLPE